MKIQSNKPPENEGQNRSAQDAHKPSTPDSGDPRGTQPERTRPACRMVIAGKNPDIAELAAAINRLPDVREAKIRRIRQSLEAGTYIIDPRKVAEKMIGEMA